MKHTSNRRASTPDRLFSAADFLLGAVQSNAGFDTLIPMYVGPPRAERPLPASIYTSDELVDAMTMLIRMGLVPARPRTHRGGTPFIKPIAFSPPW